MARASITKVAVFLGVHVEDNNSGSNLIELVMEKCIFDNIKKAANLALSSGMKGDATHLRKGRIGDWKGHFTDNLKSEFEA